ncbi:hypothetical protein BT67DRAFT_440473 [Trichocladium antarcticum]|uniref:Small EDRK-rich factor-like N-terminal domain-containing protein n=1 Tax=Trichocladium antarcticum TaxID=1450529 RepID=A0AAN6UPL2_9PEZI|nr:hypothetical protein BT67DRAFT_440473 [Trichocladium antarcticum]
MSRGNQRDKAREAAQKKLAASKKSHGMSGSEMAKAKEEAAAKMREKQAAGTRQPSPQLFLHPAFRFSTPESRDDTNPARL